MGEGLTKKLCAGGVDRASRRSCFKPIPRGVVASLVSDADVPGPGAPVLGGQVDQGRPTLAPAGACMDAAGACNSGVSVLNCDWSAYAPFCSGRVAP